MDHASSYIKSPVSSPINTMICFSARETSGSEKDTQDEDTENNNSSSLLGSRIPIELVDEILIRLPAEILVRNEIVSRSWRSHLRSKPFVDLHTRRWRSRYGIITMKITCGVGNNPFSYFCLFFDFEDSSTSTNIPSIKVQTLRLEEPVDSTLRSIGWSKRWPMNAKYAVVSSCNGLVLIELSINTFSGIIPRLLIYNPVSGSYKLFPMHGQACWEYFFWTMIYVSDTGRYKIVGLPTSALVPFPVRCFVLEMSDDFNVHGECWKEISIPKSIYSEHDSVGFLPGALPCICRMDFINLITLFHSSVFAGGKIHFLIDIMEYERPVGRVVETLWIPSLLSFDMATEQFDFRGRFPEVRSLGNHDVHFTSQKAFYTMYKLQFPDQNYEIWALRGLENGASAGTAEWVKLQHVMISDAMSAMRSDSLALLGIPTEVPLGVVMGVDEREMLALRWNGIIFVYDMISGKWNRAITDDSYDPHEQEQMCCFSRFSGAVEQRRRYVIHMSSLVRCK